MYTAVETSSLCACDLERSPMTFLHRVYYIVWTVLWALLLRLVI
jgi:hypothetical protein